MRALVVEGSVDIDRVTELLHPMLWRGLAPE
jgi:hypothetical protein